MKQQTSKLGESIHIFLAVSTKNGFHLATPMVSQVN